MIKPHTTASIAFALGLLAVQVPTSGYAKETTPAEATPVQIQRLGTTQTTGKAPHAWMALSFLNKSNVAAQEIRFVLRYNGLESVVVDKGTFSPGVIINHQFVVPGGVQRLRATTEAVVRYVKYVDGTEWGTPL